MPFEPPEVANISEFTLDINSYIVKHPSSTFFVRVEGHVMKEYGIFSDDILVIDRSIDPKPESLVLAVHNGEFVIQEFRGKISGDFQLWGVVIAAIHEF